MKKNKCPVCNKEYLNLTLHLIKKQDLNHKKYIKSVYEEIDKYLKNNLYVFEIEKILEDKYPFKTESLINSRSYQIYKGNRRKIIFQQRRKGKENPVFKEGTIEKISHTVSTLWKDGKYDSRINGMKGRIGKKHPEFNIKTYLRNRFSKICLTYHHKLECNAEKCTFNQNIINVHHVDENYSNFLITNLEPLCVSHHMDNHYRKDRNLQPFVEITRDFKFDSAHNLLNYDGKCKKLHGHTYFLSVSIKKRINKESGMVMDFSTLNKIVNKYIVEEFDHGYINDIMEENPTAENMLVWIWGRLEKNALLKGMNKIKIWESPESSAEVTKDDMLNSTAYLKTYYDDMEKFFNEKIKY
jgi:6-pyruvoyltetrahydropterin/6-carboxytetrahydropterin synthase